MVRTGDVMDFTDKVSWLHFQNLMYFNIHHFEMFTFLLLDITLKLSPGKKRVWDEIRLIMIHELDEYYRYVLLSTTKCQKFRII